MFSLGEQKASPRPLKQRHSQQEQPEPLFQRQPCPQQQQWQLEWTQQEAAWQHQQQQDSTDYAAAGSVGRPQQVFTRFPFWNECASGITRAATALRAAVEATLTPATDAATEPAAGDTPAPTTAAGAAASSAAAPAAFAYQFLDGTSDGEELQRVHLRRPTAIHFSSEVRPAGAGGPPAARATAGATANRLTAKGASISYPAAAALLRECSTDKPHSEQLPVATGTAAASSSGSGRGAAPSPSNGYEATTVNQHGWGNMEVSSLCTPVVEQQLQSAAVQQHRQQQQMCDSYHKRRRLLAGRGQQHYTLTSQCPLDEWVEDDCGAGEAPAENEALLAALYVQQTRCLLSPFFSRDFTTQEVETSLAEVVKLFADGVETQLSFELPEQQQQQETLASPLQKDKPVFQDEEEGKEQQEQLVLQQEEYPQQPHFKAAQSQLHQHEQLLLQEHLQQQEYPQQQQQQPQQKQQPQQQKQRPQQKQLAQPQEEVPHVEEEDSQQQQEQSQQQQPSQQQQAEQSQQHQEDLQQQQQQQHEQQSQPKQQEQEPLHEEFQHTKGGAWKDALGVTAAAEEEEITEAGEARLQQKVLFETQRGGLFFLLHCCIFAVPSRLPARVMALNILKRNSSPSLLPRDEDCVTVEAARSFPGERRVYNGSARRAFPTGSSRSQRRGSEGIGRCSTYTRVSHKSSSDEFGVDRSSRDRGNSCCSDSRSSRSDGYADPTLSRSEDSSSSMGNRVDCSSSDKQQCECVSAPEECLGYVDCVLRPEGVQQRGPVAAGVGYEVAETAADEQQQEARAAKGARWRQKQQSQELLYRQCVISAAATEQQFEALLERLLCSSGNEPSATSSISRALRATDRLNTAAREFLLFYRKLQRHSAAHARVRQRHYSQGTPPFVPQHAGDGSYACEGASAGLRRSSRSTVTPFLNMCPAASCSAGRRTARSLQWEDKEDVSVGSASFGQSSATAAAAAWASSEDSKGSRAAGDTGETSSSSDASVSFPFRPPLWKKAVETAFHLRAPSPAVAAAGRRCKTLPAVAAGLDSPMQVGASWTDPAAARWRLDCTREKVGSRSDAWQLLLRGTVAEEQTAAAAAAVRVLGAAAADPLKSSERLCVDFRQSGGALSAQHWKQQQYQRKERLRLAPLNSSQEPATPAEPAIAEEAAAAAEQAVAQEAATAQQEAAAVLFPKCLNNGDTLQDVPPTLLRAVLSFFPGRIVDVEGIDLLAATLNTMSCSSKELCTLLRRSQTGSSSSSRRQSYSSRATASTFRPDEGLPSRFEERFDALPLSCAQPLVHCLETLHLPDGNMNWRTPSMRHVLLQLLQEMENHLQRLRNRLKVATAAGNARQQQQQQQWLRQHQKRQRQQQQQKRDVEANRPSLYARVGEAFNLLRISSQREFDDGTSTCRHPHFSNTQTARLLLPVYGPLVAYLIVLSLRRVERESGSPRLSTGTAGTTSCHNVDDEQEFMQVPGDASPLRLRSECSTSSIRSSFCGSPGSWSCSYHVLDCISPAAAGTASGTFLTRGASAVEELAAFLATMLWRRRNLRFLKEPPRWGSLSEKAMMGVICPRTSPPTSAAYLGQTCGNVLQLERVEDLQTLRECATPVFSLDAYGIILLFTIEGFFSGHRTGLLNPRCVVGLRFLYIWKLLDIYFYRYSYLHCKTIPTVSATGTLNEEGKQIIISVEPAPSRNTGDPLAEALSAPGVWHPSYLSRMWSSV